MNYIEVTNARVHNLKNVTLKIPKGKITVITGVSGSGKSSLAFDTLYEEGRNRYLRSIGLLKQFDQVDSFDEIKGLSPTVAVEQRIIRQFNPRSVVGTRTRIFNDLQVVFAMEGDQLCPNCGYTVRTRSNCVNCKTYAEPLPPGLFSFNGPLGMCIKCLGRGIIRDYREEYIVSSPDQTLSELLTDMTTFRDLRREFSDFCEVYRVNGATEYGSLPREVQLAFLYGSKQTKFTGLITYMRIKGGIARYGRTVTCPDCNGYRIGQEGLAVTLNDKHIGELSSIPVEELYSFLTDIDQSNFAAPSKQSLKHLLRRLQNLMDVGLPYLSLYRSTPTLSGGEIQRLFLSMHLETELDGLIYIFDEPTASLHESEKASLIQKISDLKRMGNTVIVVEHDPQTIKVADHIVVMGPKAGIQGGQVVFQGTYEDYFSYKTKIDLIDSVSLIDKTTKREVSENHPKLTIHGAATNNLKRLTVHFPLQVMVGVAGVSGSGKSSLISGTLVPLLKQHFHLNQDLDEDQTDEDEDNEGYNGLSEDGACYLTGADLLKRCVVVTQAPIGRNKTSTPVSYIGIWDSIRSLYASQPLAKERGYKAGDFSFNSTGRCPECKGEGEQKTHLGYGNFAFEPCSECKGVKYRLDILDVKYNDKNIHEVLQMSVSEAIQHFRSITPIVLMLKTLERVGMGYITLGQSALSISGGEAQRIKLAKELGKGNLKDVIYILDEPSTGLSNSDTLKLIHLLEELVRQGSSIIIIEHDPLILSHCDWIIELGPGGGSKGGELIAEGTPDELKGNRASKIGPFLFT